MATQDALTLVGEAVLSAAISPAVLPKRRAIEAGPASAAAVVDSVVAVVAADAVAAGVVGGAGDALPRGSFEVLVGQV